MITRETWAKVVSLSLIPAVWALAAGLTGVKTAPVAMITATVYVIGAKNPGDNLTMTVGCLLGIVFSYVASFLMDVLPFSQLVSTCIVLIVVVAIIVILQSLIPRIANLYAWLCTFSVGLTLFPLFPQEEHISIIFQLVISSLVGVWFIGWLGGKLLSALLKNKNGK